MDGQTQKKTAATKSAPVILHSVYLKYHKIELNIIYGWQIEVFTIGFCERHNAALINVKWNCCLARWLYTRSTRPPLRFWVPRFVSYTSSRRREWEIIFADESVLISASGGRWDEKIDWPYRNTSSLFYINISISLNNLPATVRSIASTSLLQQAIKFRFDLQLNLPYTW